MTDRRCPTHPSQPYEDCPICEARIQRAELELEEDSPDEADLEARRYEAWLSSR